MGERVQQAPFEVRRTRMRDLTLYLTHEALSSNWDITYKPIEHAVETVFAADTRLELLQETKKYVAELRLPVNPENLAMAEQLIKDIDEPKPSMPIVDQAAPRVSLRRYMAKKLARLEHLCAIDSLTRQRLSLEKRKELNKDLFPGGITVEDRVKFVGILAATTVDKIDDFLNTVPPQGKPTVMTTTSGHLQDIDRLLRQSAELLGDFNEAS